MALAQITSLCGIFRGCPVRANGHCIAELKSTCSPIPPEITKWTLRRALTGHRSMSIRPDQHCESATIVELQQKNALIGLVHSSGAFLIGEMVFGQNAPFISLGGQFGGLGQYPLDPSWTLHWVRSCGRMAFGLRWCLSCTMWLVDLVPQAEILWVSNRVGNKLSLAELNPRKGKFNLKYFEYVLWVR